MDAADQERVRTTRLAEGTPPDTQVEACLRLAGGVPRFPQFRRRSICRTREMAATRTGTDFVSFVGVSPMGSSTRCMSTPRTDWTAAALIDQVH